MAELPYMQFFPADYLRDTEILSLSAQGGWMRMLCSMWHPSRRGVLGLRLQAMARLLHASEQTTKSIIDEIEDCGVGQVEWSDDGERVTVTCRRMVRDWEFKSGVVTTNAANGALGARSKWGGNSNQATRSQRLAEARKKGTHTQKEWASLVDICGCCVRCGAEGVELVKDHIKPIYQGGSDSIDNIQPLCRRCNASKGPEDTDHRPSDWRTAIETPGECLANACLPEARSQNIVIDTQRAHEIPTLEQVKTYAASAPSPITEACTMAFHDTQQAAGWITKHGHSIADWRAALRRYASVWNENEKSKPGPRTDHRQAKAATEYPEPKPMLPRL